MSWLGKTDSDDSFVTRKDLKKISGGGSVEIQTVRGVWSNGGTEGIVRAYLNKIPSLKIAILDVIVDINSASNLNEGIIFKDIELSDNIFTTNPFGGYPFQLLTEEGNVIFKREFITPEYNPTSEEQVIYNYTFVI